MHLTTAMNLTLQRLLLAASLLTAYTASSSCLHYPTMLRRDGMRRVDVNPFGYTGDKGPLNWAALNPNNTVCATSSTQSPINLDDQIPFAMEPPRITINPIPVADLQNIGTTLQIPINGTAVAGSTTFEVRQFHFHTPSEHRINEEYFPLEMHVASLTPGELLNRSRTAFSEADSSHYR
jgi:carbonic anhydrase